MKKAISFIVALVLILAGVVSFAGCETENEKLINEIDDNYFEEIEFSELKEYEFIKNRGYFVCGYSDFKPMSYVDESGKLTGYDIEYAQAVANYLGLQVRFKPIEANDYYKELYSGDIDCIWSGFLITKERRRQYSFSNSYKNASQCIVVRKSDLSSYNNADSFSGKRGIAVAESISYEYAEQLVGNSGGADIAFEDIASINKVLSGQNDFAVVNIISANDILREEEYSSLSIVESVIPEPEEYAVGFRAGSDFIKKVNEAMDNLDLGPFFQLNQTYWDAKKEPNLGFGAFFQLNQTGSVKVQPQVIKLQKPKKGKLCSVYRAFLCGFLTQEDLKTIQKRQFPSPELSKNLENQIKKAYKDRIMAAPGPDGNPRSFSFDNVRFYYIGMNEECIVVQFVHLDVLIPAVVEEYFIGCVTIKHGYFDWLVYIK